jgi:Cu/Ag efflux protein CusF
MKKFALLSSFLLLAGAASATPAKAHHGAKAHETAKAASTAAPAEVAGEIVSVDAMKKSVTFRNEQGENVTWPVDGAAVASLKTVKTGEKVMISYAVDANGAPKAITAIKPVPSKVATK